MEGKMSKTGFAILAAFAATLITAGIYMAPAHADDDESGWHHRMFGGWMAGQWAGENGRGFMRRFAMIDGNDDGRISDDEAAAQRETVFLVMDADDNGELTEVEYMETRMGPGDGRNETRMKARQETKRARFAPMDTDKSGTVSKAEFMAQGKARFAKADADGDGIVTPWEFRSVHQE
jgi:hypothetical protein